MTNQGVLLVINKANYDASWNY